MPISTTFWAGWAMKMSTEIDGVENEDQASLLL
jgi:hypothetical protein